MVKGKKMESVMKQNLDLNKILFRMRLFVSKELIDNVCLFQ